MWKWVIRRMGGGEEGQGTGDERIEREKQDK